MERLSNWLWNDWFWFPKGLSFKDLRDKPGYHYAKPQDLPMMVVYAVVIYIIRRIFEKVATQPLTRRLGLKFMRKSNIHNDTLEKFFQTERQPKSETIEVLASEIGWSSKKVDNWFRRRRNKDRPSLYKKMAEASWRAFFYTCIFIFAMSILLRAPWFWDTMYCWVDFPRQSMWPSVYYYYMLEGGFYLSLLFSLLFMGDITRKDFTEQLIHHLATILLIVFSYVANFVRVGTLVMAIHDISDIILEVGKCILYAQNKDMANKMFNVFAVVFIVSRIIIFPCVILHTTWIKSLKLFGHPYPGYYLFNILLSILQCLHIFWAATILKMAYKKIKEGKIHKDERSDAEESTSDDDDEAKKTQ